MVPFKLCLLCIWMISGQVDEGGEAEVAASGGMSSAQMTLVHLLAVLRGYLRCIPETFAEARFDLSRLLPEV